MPKLDFDWKDYFTIEEYGTKVKIKIIQYSSIGIALSFFVLKRYFLRAEHGRRQKGAREGCGPLVCFSTSTHIDVLFNKHSYCKNNPTYLTNHWTVVLCCADRHWKAGVIKANWRPGYKVFRTKLDWNFLKR